MKRLLFASLAAFITFSSCKKENTGEDSPIPMDSVLDYMPLSIGNYWIYEHTICDSGGVNCDDVIIDTSVVEKDTVIGGNTYFKIQGSVMLSQFPVYLRDSGDYIVDETGGVVFTHTDSTSIFNESIIPTTHDGSDTLYYWYYQMTKNPGLVDVGAGSFDCLDMKGHFYRKVDDFNPEHNMHNLYSKNVGMVKKTTFFASNLAVVKQELIGYHIEPDGGITP